MNIVFNENLFILEELFGNKEVSKKLDRLKYIFENTEKNWKKNLKFFKNSEVKFLLICEAPPFSETKTPTYFYNQSNRTFNQTIWKVFFGNENLPKSDSEYYKRISEKGFLLIDNLPFSMKYDSKHRKKVSYKNMIKNSLEWVLEKLNNEKICISKDVKIALGFKLNAIKFLEVTHGKIKLKNRQVLNFSEANIAANGAGFPDSKLIHKIFFGDFSNYKYYNGEEKNPYKLENDYELSFINPKSLFWYYEKHHYLGNKNGINENYKYFIENLIHNKLSEYHRSDYELWEMYFENAVK